MIEPGGPAELLKALAREDADMVRALAFAHVALIAVVNLWVSFGLALYVALQARRARVGSVRRLLGAYLARLARSPLEFLFPPAAAAASGRDAGGRGGG